MRDEQDLPHAHKFFGLRLEPFFYWHLVVTLRRPTVESRGKAVQRLAICTSKLAALITPTIVALFLLLYVLSLKRELSHKGRSLESCSCGLEPVWDESDAEPTMSTVFQTLTTSTGETWWFVDTPAVLDTWTSTSSDISVPAPTQNPYVYETEPMDSPSPDPTYIPAEGASNRLVPYVPFTWPMELRLELERATDKLLTGLEKAWSVLQMVFHWPLVPGQ